MLALIWVRVGPYVSSPDSAALFWPLGESAGKGRGQLGGHWRPLSPPGSAVEFQEASEAVSLPPGILRVTFQEPPSEECLCHTLTLPALFISTVISGLKSFLSL